MESFGDAVVFRKPPHPRDFIAPEAERYAQCAESFKRALLKRPQPDFFRFLYYSGSWRIALGLAPKCFLNSFEK